MSWRVYHQDEGSENLQSGCRGQGVLNPNDAEDTVTNQLNAWEKSAKSNSPRESAIQTLSKSSDSTDNMVGKQQMNKKMNNFITCLLLVVLLGVIPSLLSAQQNQSAQRLEQKTETLDKRVSELQKQLQTVENVEKMELQAKLAEANAKLANAEFGKFERELRDSNNEWLRNWAIILLAFLSVVGVGIWSWLKSRTNQLIETEVEKNLKGFKEAVEAQDLIKNQLRELEKEYATSILRDFARVRLDEENFHPEEIKVFRDETLLEIFADERYDIVFRYRIAEILAARKCPQLVFPLFEFVNSVIDSNSDIHFDAENHLRHCVTFFTHIPTAETYQGLNEFLNRLLTENLKHKDLFLTETVFALAWVSIKLNIGNSVPILRMAIPYLEVQQREHQAIQNLARYFDIFNEPAGIKEILINHVTSESTGMEDVEDWCLKLLQKHDPQYVADWRASKTTDNSEA